MMIVTVQYRTTSVCSCIVPVLKITAIERVNVACFLELLLYSLQVPPKKNEMDVSSKTNEMKRVTRSRKIVKIGEDLNFIPDSIVNEKSVKVRSVNLSHNNIQKLDGLERFVNLVELNLDNNAIDDRTDFPAITSLQTLTLNNNNLNSLEIVVGKIGKAYPSLTYLSLLGNKACPTEFSDPSNKPSDYQKYRCYVTCFLSELQFLDWKVVTTTERFKGKELFTKPGAFSDRPKSSKSYTPLPKTEESTFDESAGKALAGKIKYKYLGRKSEGNRFIRNNDL